MFNPDRPADDPVFCKGFCEGYRIGARDALNAARVDAKEDEIAKLTCEVETPQNEVQFLRTQAYPEEYNRS